MRALVIGMARTGVAVTERLRREGWDVVVTDDNPGGPHYEERAALVRAAGAEVVASSEPQYAELVAAADLVMPSPLVPPSHPAIGLANAHDVPIRSEIDLAAERARVPLVAVTGTNGKTTVTTMIAAILEASGISATAAGNIGRTLLEATDDDVEVLVAEVSSFQLEFAPTFAPAVAVLLGLAEDHLDWHGSFAAYVAAKSNVFARQRADGVLVVDADDAEARRTAQLAPGRVIEISITDRTEGRFGVRNGALVTPQGDEIIAIDAMPRALPHDLTNALAAVAAAREVGATLEGARRAIAEYATLPHRVARIGEHGGVTYYDDSKATNPHAALHAMRSFDSVVLLAGGRNKGLDLSVLADGADHIRAVIAFGDAADEVERAFDGVRPVRRVTSMKEAVRIAHELARPGDAVLLSPACASFDAYESYAARGDDFAREVQDLLAGVSS
jgi:UDP-N-acetylmuramoylalanine--D-glutamate ligase